MTNSEMELPGQDAVEVETACGGNMPLVEDTPHADHNGRPLYFCQEECKTLFENDPLNSCLVDRVQTQSI